MSLADLFDGRRAAIERRFWARVAKRTPDECWEWAGSRDKGGYGRLTIKKRGRLAHRISFFIAFGWEPRGVLHKCDNPPCVNPRHLFGGTQVENLRDAYAKGRMPNQTPPAVVSTIVALRELGLTYRVIAHQVGVNPSTVGRVLKRQLAPSQAAEQAA